MVDCDFCERSIPASAAATTHGASVALERRPDRIERDDCSCADCLAEIRELADEMDALEAPATASGPNDAIGAAETCGLCDGRLDGARGQFVYEHDGEVDRRHALCPGCVDVVGTFLANVPETPPDDEASSATSDVDRAELAPRFHDCTVGDVVRLEVAHGSDAVEGTVAQVDTAFTETRMVLEPESAGVREYYVYDDPVDDRPLRIADRRADGTLESRGPVTAIDVA